MCFSVQSLEKGRNFRKILLDSLESAKFTLDSELGNKINKSLETFNNLIKDEKKLDLSYDKAKITENQGKIKVLDSQIEQLGNDKNNINSAYIPTLASLLSTEGSDMPGYFSEEDLSKSDLTTTNTAGTTKNNCLRRVRCARCG